MKIIERPIYLNRIIRQLDRGMMLVLVGQRRVGKSFMLRALADWLSRNKPAANVVFIDKDFGSFDLIRSSADLYAHVLEVLPSGGDNYLLIDEVQDIEGYETALRSLYAEGRCQIVVTGSNAYMFSSEIATKFSGRYIEIPIRSLDYGEFLTFHRLQDSNESLLSYLQFGGMPGLANYHFDEVPEIKAYLQGVYNNFFSDHGMRNCISGEMPNVFGSIEKVMEGVVRHHLLILNYDVYVGVLPSGEIDFVARNGDETVYVQVCYKLSGPDTIKREFGNLQAIGDDYPKYVVTMEDIVGPLKEYPGIRHVHLRDFLTNDKF